MLKLCCILFFVDDIPRFKILIITFNILIFLGFFTNIKKLRSNSCTIIIWIGFNPNISYLESIHQTKSCFDSWNRKSFFLIFIKRFFITLIFLIWWRSFLLTTSVFLSWVMLNNWTVVRAIFNLFIGVTFQLFSCFCISIVKISHNLLIKTGTRLVCCKLKLYLNFVLINHLYKCFHCLLIESLDPFLFFLTLIVSFIVHETCNNEIPILITFSESMFSFGMNNNLLTLYYNLMKIH